MQATIFLLWVLTKAITSLLSTLLASLLYFLQLGFRRPLEPLSAKIIESTGLSMQLTRLFQQEVRVQGNLPARTEPWPSWWTAREVVGCVPSSPLSWGQWGCLLIWNLDHRFFVAWVLYLPVVSTNWEDRGSGHLSPKAAHHDSQDGQIVSSQLSELRCNVDNTKEVIKEMLLALQCRERFAHQNGQ